MRRKSDRVKTPVVASPTKRSSRRSAKRSASDTEEKTQNSDNEQSEQNSGSEQDSDHQPIAKGRRKLSRNTKATNDEKPVRTRRGRPAKNIETVTEEDEGTESTEQEVAVPEENNVAVEKGKSPSPEPVKVKSPVKHLVKESTPEPTIVVVEEVASVEAVSIESVEPKTNSETVDGSSEATLPNENTEQNNDSGEKIVTPSADQKEVNNEIADEENRTRSKASIGRRKHRKSSSDNVEAPSPEIVKENQRKRKNRFSSPAAKEPDNVIEQSVVKDASNASLDEPAEEVAPIESKTPEPEVAKDIEQSQDCDGRKSRGEKEKENKDKKKSDEKGASSEKKQKPVRKRKWLTQKSTESKPQILAISTDSLKNLISDVKPVPLSDVKLDSSPEPEEIEIVSRSDAAKSTTNDLRDRTLRKEHRNESKQDKQLDENTTTTSTNRKISIVSDDTAKVQRPPSPPKFSSSNILFITNLVRPFTVLQLKGLLARTGKIVDDGFWIDKIKSKCYVKYETEE